MTEYSTMARSDFAMFNCADVVLILVLPKMDNQVAWELTRPHRSHCQTYDLLTSINIILERLDCTMRLQLNLPDDDVTDPLLQNFSQDIRYTGES